jgi:hypothetical protein
MWNYLPWPSKAELATLPSVSAAISAVQSAIVVITILLFLSALAIAFLIPHQPGAAPKDPAIRRSVFWLMCLWIPLVMFSGYIIAYSTLITVRGETGGFLTSNFLTLAACLAAVIGLGYLLSKTVLKMSKFGDVFGMRRTR